MKKKILFVCAALVLLLVTLFAAKKTAEAAARAYVARHTAPTVHTEAETEPTIPTTVPTVPETTTPTTVPTEPTVETYVPDVYDFTAEERLLLLKIGMAERGDTGCEECVAMVMRTVLNRVEADRFSSTIRGVIYAEGQFTPVAEGTFEDVDPNDLCYEALKMVTKGWDETQGALYYEWSDGETWHSQNRNLLFQHHDMRLYD